MGNVEFGIGYVDEDMVVLLLYISDDVKYRVNVVWSCGYGEVVGVVGRVVDEKIVWRYSYVYFCKYKCDRWEYDGVGVVSVEIFE